MNVQTTERDGTVTRYLDNGNNTATHERWTADGRLLDSELVPWESTVDEPDPPTPLDVVVVLELLREPLAGLTSTSTSTQQRAALLGLRATIDSLTTGATP